MSENVELIIGKRIQQIRKSRKLTQQQFSEMIGISTNYLSDVERGKSSIRMDKLVAIMNALRCSADDVFVDVIDCGRQIKEAKLSDRIANLSASDQETVFAVLNLLIDRFEK